MLSPFVLDVIKDRCSSETQTQEEEEDYNGTRTQGEYRTSVIKNIKSFYKGLSSYFSWNSFAFHGTGDGTRNYNVPHDEGRDRGLNVQQDERRDKGL